MDSTPAVPYDPRYLAFFEHFNAEDYFEAHEVLEDLWLEDQSTPARKFYQGLIQAAVALHHYRRGNLSGARKLRDSCAQLLAPYGPVFMDLDVAGLIQTMRAYVREDLPPDHAPLPRLTLGGALAGDVPDRNTESEGAKG